MVAFARTVAADRHPWPNRLNEHRVVADFQAVVCNLVNVHKPDLVRRRNQLGFHIPSQVSQIQKAKAAKGEKEAQAASIVGLVLRLRLVFLSNWIGDGAIFVVNYFAAPAQTLKPD